ncbi:Dimethylsulfonioproprionate demethylase DmdA [Jannaschia seosinensis]|uniref:Dimethylsulfonioproprionate demethylase DmdA n=2 Tax=Jannaschia seosinensis TaxID=313367 RepID=A0A0M7BB90_9RHOB|nr:Dimethylsulfonioproprionate demethylase DmdA [Jannaschia seosinensis]
MSAGSNGVATSTTFSAVQPENLDQSDRSVPRNLRQSGPTPVEMLISTRVRKSPFWHLSHAAGCWRATVYNRMYHPRGYVRPQDGGAMAEYEALVNHVTLWDVAVERQIRIKGPDAEAFVNRLITRDATLIRPMTGKYVILCNEDGGIINDPVLLRLSDDEFWFSISDSDLELWLRGVNVGLGMNVMIGEIDVAPLQIQGPKSEALMVEMFGEEISELPYYGMLEAKIADCNVVVSQTGFSGEKGYEIYLREATRDADALWNAVIMAGERHSLVVTAPAHHRRIAAGILSWGQDIDQHVSPFQCNLSYQVPREKSVDYVGRRALEAQRMELDAGRNPFRLIMAGLTFDGQPVVDYAPDFWLILPEDGGTPIGYITSAWFSPELDCNIALGWVPGDKATPGARLSIALPDEYAEAPGMPASGKVVDLPFRPSINPSARERGKAGPTDNAT